MRLKALGVLIVSGLLTVLAMPGLSQAAEKPRSGWFAPTSKPRNSGYADWEVQVGSAARAIQIRPLPLNVLKAGVEVWDAGSKVTVEIPRLPGAIRFSPEGIMFLHDEGSGVIALPGGGEVRIVALGSRHRDEDGKPLRPYWCGPGERQELAPERIEALVGAPMPRVRELGKPTLAGRHRLGVVLQAKGVKNPLWTEVAGLFNAGTRQRAGLRTTSHETEHSASHLVVEALAWHWHDGPVVLAVDLAWGEFEEQSAPLVVERELHFGPIAGRFLHLAEGIVNTGEGRENGLAATLKRAGEKSGASLFFALSPAVHGPACEIGVRDRQGVFHGGSPDNGRGSFGAGWTDYHAGCRSFEELEPGDIHEWILRCRPHLRRLVFHLPGFPGLPNQADAVGNVFDLKIPWVRLWNPESMTDFLEKVTGLQGFDAYQKWLEKTDLLFPMDFREATVEEIAEKLVAISGVPFSVDLEKGSIEPERSR